MGTRESEMYSDSGYILKVKPTRFADRFNVVKEKKKKKSEIIPRYMA